MGDAWGSIPKGHGGDNLGEFGKARNNKVIADYLAFLQRGGYKMDDKTPFPRNFTTDELTNEDLAVLYNVLQKSKLDKDPEFGLPVSRDMDTIWKWINNRATEKIPMTEMEYEARNRPFTIGDQS